MPASGGEMACPVNRLFTKRPLTSLASPCVLFQNRRNIVSDYLLKVLFLRCWAAEALRRHFRWLMASHYVAFGYREWQTWRQNSVGIITFRIGTGLQLET